MLKVGFSGCAGVAGWLSAAQVFVQTARPQGPPIVQWTRNRSFSNSYGRIIHRGFRSCGGLLVSRASALSFLADPRIRWWCRCRSVAGIRFLGGPIGPSAAAAAAPTLLSRRLGGLLGQFLGRRRRESIAPWARAIRRASSSQSSGSSPASRSGIDRRGRVLLFHFQPRTGGRLVPAVAVRASVRPRPTGSVCRRIWGQSNCSSGYCCSSAVRTTASNGSRPTLHVRRGSEPIEKPGRAAPIRGGLHQLEMLVARVCPG